MAGWGHLYVTAHGHYPSGRWAGETAQVGFRFSTWSNLNENGPLVTLPDHGAVSLQTGDRDINGYTVTKTFGLPSLAITPGQDDDVLDDLVVDFATFLAQLNAYQAMPFQWDSFKVAPVELGTGKYLAGASIWTRNSPQIPSNSNALPPECAIAVSFRAPIVGRRGRGRMYIPALNVTAIKADGLVSANALNALSAGGQTLVTSLANMPGIDLQNSGLVIGSGASRIMVKPSECRVGDHVDAQRRRQHQAEELYTTKPV
jgi:hypothetical protein